MKKGRNNHSFATRLSRWVMLVLFVMMCALGFLLYYVTEALLEEVGGDTVHGSMQSSERRIRDFMSDVSVAAANNVFDIERNLSRPDEMLSIVERIVNQNTRIRSCGISFVENYYPQKGRRFCPYAWRTDSLQVKTQQLDNILMDYLDSEWFQEAVAKDSAYWSEPFIDGHDAKTPLIAFLQPIHDKQGNLVAILGADLSLDFLANVLEEQDSLFTEAMWAWGSDSTDYKAIQSYILSREGLYLTHPDPWRIMKGNFFIHIKDIDEKGVAEETIKKMSEGKSSKEETYGEMLVNRKPSFLYYSPVKGTDWILVVSVPRIVLDLTGMVMGLIILFVIAFVLQVTFFVCKFVIKRTANPLRVLANTADKVAQGQFDTPLPTIKHQDEIHQLRDSFENMQRSLAAYVEDLKKTTAAKASMESELEIAHGIQMSMLPKTYPAFPNREDIDIYGQLTPAKAVGGDLYDFFIRDDKLFFCIGDVSGKGVPASLVMPVTRSLFRNIALYTARPDEIVAALNEAMSDNNETSMFVTFFVGVLDLRNGHLSYSNAGHDMPLMLTGDEVLVLPCDPNVPVGLMPEWKFTCQETDFKTGATLFLYTDGLNEAEDVNHNQFGMERIQLAANAASCQPEALITTMKNAVVQFVGDAEQSDDMTMFAIQYKNTSTINN